MIIEKGIQTIWRKHKSSMILLPRHHCCSKFDMCSCYRVPGATSQVPAKIPPILWPIPVTAQERATYFYLLKNRLMLFFQVWSCG